MGRERERGRWCDSDKGEERQIFTDLIGNVGQKQKCNVKT